MRVDQRLSIFRIFQQIVDHRAPYLPVAELKLSIPVQHPFFDVQRIAWNERRSLPNGYLSG